MRNSKIIMTLMTGLLVTGCATSLTSKKVSLDEKVGTGSNYYLPQQTIRIAITYELRSCTSKPDITKQAAISTVNGIDSNAYFHVPSEDLASRFKTTSLTVATFDNGILRSLGATVDDRTSEIVGGIVGSAGSIARIASGAAFSDDKIKCSDAIKKTVKARDDLITKLRNAESFTGDGQRAGAIDALNRLNTQLRFVRNIEYLPNPNETVDYLRVSKQFNESPSASNTLNSWLSGSEGNVGEMVAKLIATTVCIRPSGVDNAVIVNSYHGCGQNSLLNQNSTIVPRVPEVPATDTTQAIPAQPATLKPPLTGLIYRQPKPVQVVVCNAVCDEPVIATQTVELAQFGPWRSIELTSKAFQDKNVMASWTSAGRLTSLTVGSASSLEALANTLNSSASSIRDTVGEVITTDQESLNAQIAITRAQADLIEQRNRLDALQTSVSDESDNGN